MTVHVTGGPNPRKITMFLEEVALTFQASSLCDARDGFS